MKAAIENNRMALGLMAVLLVAVLGFTWWQFLYKPASVEHHAAELANQTAQSALSDARNNLQKAQQEVDAAKRENGGKFDTSIAKVQVAREAVPDKARIDDALLVLAKLADRSGIRTNWNLQSMSDDATTSSSSSAGDAQAMEVDVDAVGKWTQLKTFISLVEGSVSSERGNLHIHGRLFNVVKIHAGSTESASDIGEGQSATSDTLEVKPGEYRYKITIAMYTSNFGADASTSGGTTATPGATTDPNAAAAGAGATGTTPAGSTTTPNAAGATSTTGTSPTGTPGATSTTPSSTGATSPTGTATGGTPSAGVGAAGTGATSTTGVTP